MTISTCDPTTSPEAGIDRGLLTRSLDGTITVPFGPEPELFGMRDTDFLEAVWYRRVITVPAEWDGLRPDGRLVAEESVRNSTGCAATRR